MKLGQCFLHNNGQYYQQFQSFLGENVVFTTQGFAIFSEKLNA